MPTEKYYALKYRYQTLSDEKEKINCLIDLVLEIRNYNVDEAFTYSEEIIERSKAIGFKEGIGRGLNHKGACFWLLGRYGRGLVTLKEALAVAKEIKNDALRARIYNNYGNIYRDLGDLSNASKYYQWALEINEELGDELSQSVVLINISNIHFDLFDYDNALEYAIKCLSIFSKYHDTVRLINVYHTLGNIYFKKDDYNNALTHFKNSLALTEPDTVGHMKANSGIGKVYYRLNNFEKSRKYLYIAREQSEKLSNIEGIIISEFYLGRIQTDENNLEAALEHFNKAMDISTEHSRKHDIMSIHELFAVVHEKLGDIPKAYEHLKLFENLKEEIFHQNTMNKLRNLQARHEVEFAIKEKELAKQSSKLKQQFIANMSHEIRTPMNAIVGMTRLLMEKNPRQDQLKYLNAITTSADNLLVIINDILDFSKIEAGKISIEHIPFSLKEVLKNVVTLLRFKAEEKGITIRFEMDPSLPDRLVGDPTRVNQVLMNLAGNAVKFTEHGQVRIDCEPVAIDSTGVKLAFHIADTGIGISEEYVSKIFESFTQAGTDVARKYGGTGLGLTISQQLVQLMEGEISVKSTLGVGTTFTFILPFRIADDQDNLVQEEFSYSDEDVSLLNRMNILLVEDNEMNVMLAMDTLKSVAEHISITEAHNGIEAVEAVRNQDFDVVLMDIQMPGMNGVEATRKIRSELDYPRNQTQIIAMTANVMREDIQQYLTNGMNDHIPKPFQKDMLFRKLLLHAPIEKVKQRMEQLKPVISEEIPSDQASNTGSPSSYPSNNPYAEEHLTNLRFLSSFAGNNKDKEKKYVQIFLQNSPNLLAQIENGIRDADYGAIKIAAHSLKTQLNYMGVKEEISRVYELEKKAGDNYAISDLSELVTNLKLVCAKAFEELETFLKS
ncbi:MAG: tetratricopeptide repeat protein [Chitinophagaceae bacterium]|nr:tetratricopeptide repeat protein [Chitinophagaceae bacterium]